jgi:hypothetical protein
MKYLLVCEKNDLNCFSSGKFFFNLQIYRIYSVHSDFADVKKKEAPTLASVSEYAYVN